MASPAPIRKLEAYGIHNRFDLKLEFHPDINVLHGRNGSGKSTLLHIIANVLNRSIERFAFLRFNKIVLSTAAARSLTLTRTADCSGERIGISLGRKELGSLSIEEAERYAAGDADEDERRRIDALKAQLPFAPPAYFPAFRTMIEAWSSIEAEAHVRRARPRAYMPTWSLAERDTQPTVLARSLFGEFVPDIRYPSPFQIERELSAEARSAALQAAEIGRRDLSKAFVQVIESILSGSPDTTAAPEGLLKEIASLLQRLEQTRVLEDGQRDPGKDVNRILRNQLVHANINSPELSQSAARVLLAYRNSLKNQEKFQEASSTPILRYVESVNEFLEGKQLVVKRRRDVASAVERQERLVWVEFPDGSLESLRSLSSGERQIVSMLHAARRASRSTEDETSVVLIDEPELSLHIDWQRRLLGKMVAQLGDRQIIVCTHSPEIGASYEDRFQGLEPLLATGRRDNRRAKIAPASR